MNHCCVRKCKDRFDFYIGHQTILIFTDMIIYALDAAFLPCNLRSLWQQEAILKHPRLSSLQSGTSVLPSWCRQWCRTSRQQRKQSERERLCIPLAVAFLHFTRFLSFAHQADLFCFFFFRCFWCVCVFCVFCAILFQIGVCQL